MKEGCFEPALWRLAVPIPPPLSKAASIHGWLGLATGVSFRRGRDALHLPPMFNGAGLNSDTFELM